MATEGRKKAPGSKTSPGAEWTNKMFETAKAQSAFTLYRDMGPGRSLRGLAELLHRRPSYIRTLKGWSAAFHWQERVAEADHAELRESLGQRKIVREQTLQRLIDAMDLATDVLIQIVTSTETIPILDRHGKAVGVRPLVAASTKLEAASRILGIAGLVPIKRTEVVETTGEALDEAADLARSLTDDQLSAMIEILKPEPSEAP